MLKKDEFLIGLLIGLVLPVLAYFIIYLGGLLFQELEFSNRVPDKDTIILISIFVNLFPIRYYFVTLKYDKTGRGVLLLTFVLGILYFIIEIT